MRRCHEGDHRRRRNHGPGDRLGRWRARATTVELFEQGPLPNPLASSMDEHRLIRHPYGDHARLRPHDRPGLRRLGPAVGRSRPASLRRHRHARPHRQRRNLGSTLGRRAGRARQADDRAQARRAAAALPPARHASGVERAFWIDTGGVLFAQDIVGGTRPASRAGSRSVRLHPETPVRSVDLERARIVTDAGATHDADVVVVAAGAWVGRLLPQLGRRLRPVAPDRRLLRPAGRPARGLGEGPDGHRQDRRRRPLPCAAGGRPRPQDRRPCRSAGPATRRPSRDAHEAEIAAPARALPQPAQGLRALAHRPAESLLLYRDRRRAFRRREAGRQGLG